MIMIKEFLVFLIFLHQINAENTTAFDECVKENGEVLSRGKVCIPKKHKQWMQWRPNEYGKNGKNELSITLSNIQIIEIGTNHITISMNTRIKWREYRLTFGVAKALLSVEDQKQIWSPRIVIGTNVVSKTKEAEEIEVSNWCNSNRAWCSKNLVKTFSLLTTVKCDMDFQTFPFDNHTCNIEESIIFSHFKTNFDNYF